MTDSLKELAPVMIAATVEEMRSVLEMDVSAENDPFTGMIHYHMGWRNADFTPAISESGKHIRPLACLLACAAAGGDWQQALPAAAAIEILHNFSLVHDDIEDGSPTRRGRKTAWTIWGMPQAINVGDAMFAYAQSAMLGLTDRGISAEIVVQAMKRFNETCVALTRGQYNDMAFETMDEVTVDEYVAMIRGKTAVLLSLATELGALVAGADMATVANYATCGLELGLAFQVIDDILGIWGDEVKIGKSAQSDILTKKKTLPVLYGLANSAELREHYMLSAETPGFVATAVDLLNASGADEYAHAQATQHSEKALTALDAAQPQGEAGVALRKLADMLLNRQS
jgi:geranylgeranyl diphosphate synthase type I